MKWLLRIALCLGFSIGLWCCGWRDTGRWKCTACGSHERRTVVGPFSWKSPLPSPYHDWFGRNLNFAHDHDWAVVGCHERVSFVAGTTSCSMRELAFQDLIRDLPDPPSARVAARRLFDLPSSKRRQELQEAEHSELWLALSSRNLWDDPNPAKSPPGYLVSYAAWWKSHPLWQDVFPKPRG